MALYRVNEFAKICHVKPAKVSTYKTRGKIIMRGDYIDDSIAQNKEIKEKWQREAREKGLKIEEDENVPEAIEETKKSVPVPKKETSAKLSVAKNDLVVPKPGRIVLDSPNIPEWSGEDEDEDYSNGQMTLDEQKKTVEIQYKLAMIRLAEQKEAKLRGETIPTDLVISVISMLGISFMNAYKNGLTKYMAELMHKAKIPPEIIAEYKGKTIDVINKSHKDAVLEAKQAVKSIVAQSSTTSETVDIDEDE